MTVLVTDSDKTFHGAGNTGPFSWTWRFLANADISVTRIAADGAETLLAEGADYALTGAGSYTGGSVTLTQALAVGEDLHVERNTAATQKTDIRNQGDFFAETHEDVFDQLAMMVQDRDRRVGNVEDAVEALQGEVADLHAEDDTLNGRADVLEARMTTLENSQHVVVLPAAGVSGDVLVFADASAGPVVVDIVAANDVLARPVVVVKTDETDNAVVITPAAGTISSSEGRTATCELSIRDESIRVVPSATLNNWFRG